MIIVGLGLLPVTACDQGSGNRAELRTCEATYGPSIIALGLLRVSGTVDITSDGRGAVHGNAHVTGNGSIYVEADVFSAGGITLNGGSLDIEGSINENVPPFAVEPAYEGAERAAAVNDNDNLGNAIRDGELRLSGRNDLVVPAGVYYFENGISASGQAGVELTGDAVFFVNGPVRMTGGSTTNDGTPYSLRIISVSSDQIRLSGNSEAVLSVHAPLADIRLSGTSAFEGSLIGYDISLSGTTQIGLAGDQVAYVDDSCKQDDYD